MSVPLTSGLASLLNPIWVSLICTNSGLPFPAMLCLSAPAIARSIGVNTPPDSANKVPAPAVGQAFQGIAARLQ